MYNMVYFRIEETGTNTLNVYTNCPDFKEYSRYNVDKSALYMTLNMIREDVESENYDVVFEIY